MSEPGDAPGPEGRHLLGKLSSFRNNALDLLLSLQREYGGISRVRLGPYLVHQVTDPRYVRHVLRDNAKNYVRGRFYRGFHLFMGRGMLTTDGAEWRTRRKVSQPFFRRDYLNAASPIITDCTADLLERWRGPAGRGEEIEVTDEVMRLSMGVVSRMFFGVDLRKDADELLPAVRFALKAMILTGDVKQVLPSWIPTRYQRDLKRHRRTINRIMNQVITDAGPESLASALLEARDENGEPWPRRQIRAELKTIFLAGHETTGCALAWTLYALALHTNVQQRLVKELDSGLGDRTPCAEDLDALPYLRQVVAESLRLYPPIWVFPRDAVEEDVIGGCRVPAGSTILLSPYAAHRSPDAWEKPDEFDPERFCPAGERPPESYFPFGSGARQCIGYHLALIEIALVVAMIVRRYRLAALPGHPVMPGALTSLRPLPGITLSVTPRDREG